LVRDWKAKYGHGIELVETFVARPPPGDTTRARIENALRSQLQKTEALTMNAELTKSTLVVSERPSDVELRQGFLLFSLLPKKEIAPPRVAVGHFP
jgi:hypothetical protein